MGRLLVVKGIDSGKSVEVGNIPITIGHMRDRSLFLQDDRVSRLHAVAERREGRTVLRDMNSTNGTFVNGEYITETLLQHEDVIQIGDTRLIYYAEDEVFPTEKQPDAKATEDADAAADATAILPEVAQETQLEIHEDPSDDEKI